jgi:transcriptional regulator with XRE-family HTH domain
VATKASNKIRRDVGRRVAELRGERAWTQERLAEKLGIGTRYLQRIEAGQINLTLDSLVHIASTLRVGVLELLAPPPTVPAPRRDK